MNLSAIITEQIAQLQQDLEAPGSVEGAVEAFENQWKALGREVITQQIQQQIESVEATYCGSHQRRERRYHSPFGTLSLTRRAYWQDGKWCCRADEVLGLPSDGWFRSVKELTGALGVSNDFSHARHLLERWSHVQVSARSVANHVEAEGEQLIAYESQQESAPVCTIRSSVSEAVQREPEREVLYIGADGIHTPLKGGHTQEAKVGVLFWQSEHRQLCPTRRDIRRRDYVATLESVEVFREQMNQRYRQWVKNRPHQVVCLGDGASWIWLMAAMLWPGCIQILDFFHLSEYVWQVARAAWPEDESEQKSWVELQQSRLKASQWREVIAAVQRLPPNSEIGRAHV